MGERCRSGARRDAELREDVLEVPRDGVLADDQRPRDLPIRLAGGDESKDLDLTAREAVPARLRGPEPGWSSGLLHPLDHSLLVFRRQVCVPLCHSDGLVAQDRLQHVQIAASHHPLRKLFALAAVRLAAATP